MPSNRGFLDFVLDQLSGVEGVSFRPMMGEFILYVKGKVVGGIYDDRLLVKKIPAARALLPDAGEEAPYEGAKPLLKVTQLEDRAFLEELFSVLGEALPTPKQKK